MPTSLHAQIPTVLSILEALKPESVLDIGCGWGKYGALIKEYIPSAKKIDAIEGFEDYLTPLHDYVYDKIYVENILDFNPDIYDVYLMIDVIEHMEKEEGIKLVKGLPNSKIVSTPMFWVPQGAEHGNELEVHKCLWTKDDVTENFNNHKIFEVGHSLIAVIGEDK